MENEYLVKLHQEILSIMDVVDLICRKYNLKYFLCGGSLLGAIRHNGFIPWDDDLDIMMPREDFDRFIKICKKELKGDFYLDWITTNKLYNRPFPKICKNNTIFLERYGKKTKENVFWGIFVDVFPLDYASSRLSNVLKRKRLYSKVCGAIILKHEPNRTSLFKRILISLVPRSVLFFLLKIIPKIFLRDSTCFTRYGSQYDISRVTVKCDEFEYAIDHNFEDRVFCIPNGYDVILRTHYGSKFMSIPSEEKRRTHYPRKVVFSDGSCMEFAECLTRVSIEDVLNDE